MALDDTWKGKAKSTNTYAAVNALKAAGSNPYNPTGQVNKKTGAPLYNTNIPMVKAFWQAGNQTNASTPRYTAPPKGPGGPANTGSGRSGGGGGAAAPAYNQGNIDWLTQLLARSRPGQVTASNLDLPDYQATFDPSMYDDLRRRLGEAVGQSRAGADTAYGNLGNYLTSNFKNAFAQGPPQQQAPGMGNDAMARMMQSQGVNPALANQQTEGWAAGQGALSSLWGLLAGNENMQQQNRLNRVQTDRGTTNMAIDAANLGGQTGIGMQQGQAQTAFNERVEAARNQIAQQEAMANWQRGNEVSDLNMANSNSYTNAQLQALLGLMPEFKGSSLTMPDLNTLLAGR